MKEYIQPTLDGMDDREILEGMNHDHVVDFVIERMQEIDKQTQTITLAEDVLSAYGVSLADKLKERKEIDEQA